MENIINEGFGAASLADTAIDRHLLVVLERYAVAKATGGCGALRTRGCGTYASRRLSGCTFALMPPMDALPDEVRAQQNRIRPLVQRLERQLGRPPRAAEVAHDLGWTLARLFHAMEAAGAGGLRVGDPPIEELERTVASTASHGATHHHLAVLAEAFMALSDREQLVLRMACEHCMHVEEMALVLGDNGDRVTRLHDGAIEKLAKRLHKPAARAACAHAPATPRPSALSAAH